MPARGGFITRVETLGGNYLYGIRVHLTGETFDLCPADICQTPAVRVWTTPARRSPEDRPQGRRIYASAGRHRRNRTHRQAAGIDVGGIEYIIDDRDGQIYFYDINALSNFVADAPHVIGFDPVENLADFLEEEVRRAR